MSNIIIINSDNKLCNEAKKYFKEVDPNHELRVFNSMAKFYSEYFNLSNEELSDSPDKNSAHNEETPRLTTIDLIFFDPSLLQEQKNIHEWIRDTKNNIKKKNYFTDELNIKFILSLPELDVYEKDDYISEEIEDIIYSPYDRLLFLQKVEIILALPEKTTPSFLFNQPVLRNIEISKKTNVTKISNCGLTIVNPGPLKPDTKVHFYLNISQHKTIEFYGISIDSMPSKIFDKMHEVTFIFFGASKVTIREIKLLFNEGPYYSGLKDEDPTHFVLNELNIFASEDEKKIREVLVLDIDEASCSNIKNLIQSEINNTIVSTETSYRNFISKYLATKAPHIFSSSDYAKVSDLTTSSIVFNVDKSSLDLTKLITPVDERDLFLNTGTSKIFKEGLSWTDLFNNEESKDSLEEAIKLVGYKKNISKLFMLELADVENEDESLKKVFLVHLTLQNKGTEIRVELIPPDLKFIKKIQDTEANNPKLKKIDLLIIDHRLISAEPAQWIENITEKLKNKGFIKNSLEIIITGDNIDPITRQYSKLKIAGLFNKPLAIQQFLVTVALRLKTEFTKYNKSNINWRETHLRAFVSVEGFIEFLSEFGATLRLKSSIANKTTLYIHGFVFDQAPNKSLCIKFYHSEEHTTEKGYFSCSVLYFGITEIFLKYVRTWVRENYAAEKNK